MKKIHQIFSPSQPNTAQMQMQMQVQMPECLYQQSNSPSRDLQVALAQPTLDCLLAARIRGVPMWKAHITMDTMVRTVPHPMDLAGSVDRPRASCPPLQPLEQQVGRWAGGQVESGLPHMGAGRPWPRLGCCTLTLAPRRLSLDRHTTHL